MTRVVGLDLSLTSTGMVLAERGRLVEVGNVVSKGAASDGYAETVPRIEAVGAEVIAWTLGLLPLDLVVIESPSHGSKYGKPHERAGLWWEVYRAVHHASVPIATVAPQTLKKYITGAGRADKKVILAHAIEQYVRTPGPRIVKHDEADAAGLAAMGARHLGEPLEVRSISDNQLDAMKGAKWPT